MNVFELLKNKGCCNPNQTKGKKNCHKYKTVSKCLKTFRNFVGHFCDCELPHIRIQTRKIVLKIHQGRWDTITTFSILLYYSTHLNEDPLGVAMP